MRSPVRRGCPLLAVALATAIAPGAPGVARQEAPKGTVAITANALGDAESDLIFVPLAPCRILDTRLAGGMIANGTTRDFEVSGTAGFDGQGGNAGGCGVPQGATSPIAAAVALNLVAVGPTGPGHLTAWEFGQPMPDASVLNYASVTGLNLAAGAILPIAGIASTDKDLSIRASTSPTHVVADVTGYFTRVAVETLVDQLKSIVVASETGVLVALADGACKELLTCTLTAPVAGQVAIESSVELVVGHTAGTLDRFSMQVETVDPVVCGGGAGDIADFEVPASLGSNPDVDATVPHQALLAISAGVTRTYRLSGRIENGAGSGDAVQAAQMTCTFVPD